MARRRKSGTGRWRSAEAWRGLVRRFAESGLTLAAYCAREGICAASFYRWRARLSDAGDREVVAGGRSMAVPSEPAFVDLGTLTRPGTRVELRVELGGGVVLQIARG